LWAAAIENATAGAGETADGSRPSAGVIGAKAGGRANMQHVAGNGPSGLVR
jgi:hypothetical protein